MSAEATGAELRRLADAGVVGVRFNLTDFDAGGLMQNGVNRLLGAVADMGWFAEVQCAARDFPAAAALLAPTGVRLLIDHLGGVDPALGLDQPGFRAVLDAAGTGRAVVKLSGAFRRSRAPYPHADVDPFVGALLEAFTPRQCVWGSDWPFINWAAKPDYGSTLALLERWVPDARDRRAVLWETPCGALRVRPGGPMTRTDRFRVAVAGAGMVTRHHLLAWRKLPQVEVVAVCARRIANAQARAAEFGVPAAYADVAEMLDRERPDVLDIATPPEAHAAQARLAAERGVHILCQKPMTPELAESERLVADVGDRVRFMVHENWRFRPQYRQAAAWLAEGRAGPVREFQMTVRSSGLVTRGASGRSFAVERQPFFAGLERFLVMEVLIHHLDTVRYLAGPLRVTAAAVGRVSTEIRGEDVALISLVAANGAPGSVTGNFSAAGFPPCRATGSSWWAKAARSHSNPECCA